VRSALELLKESRRHLRRQELPNVTTPFAGLKLTLLMVLLSLVSWAQTVNPAVLHIGPGANTGLTCPGTSTDVALGCGIDPNPVPVDHLDIFVNSGGVGSIGGLFYLIVGIPLEAGDPAPALVPNIVRVDAYNPYAPTPVWLGQSNAVRSATPCGSLPEDGANAYAACGLDVNNGSNNFGNWSGAVDPLGIEPVRFALYYYDLTSAANLGGKGLYDVFLGSALPVGTMEVAYGCATGTCSEPCYITPFTEAGMAVVVPEPASMLLVGGTLLGLLGWRSRRGKEKR
jgi:hypothetical protein